LIAGYGEEMLVIWLMDLLEEILNPWGISLLPG
jgi:hypothetical protein